MKVVGISPYFRVVEVNGRVFVVDRRTNEFLEELELLPDDSLVYPGRLATRLAG